MTVYLIALLADGHLLVEGAPGWQNQGDQRPCIVDASFKRIQFTPDLMPADITGADIYRRTSLFRVHGCPVFHTCYWPMKSTCAGQSAVGPA